MGGFWRLSGIVRSGGGIPIPSRARRRASLPTVNRGFFFRGIGHRTQTLPHPSDTAVGGYLLVRANLTIERRTSSCRKS